MISTKDMYDSLRPKRTKRNIIITASVIAVIVLIILYNIFKDSGPEFLYTTVKIENGNVASLVSATGKISATNEVLIGSQVSGTISAVFVEENDNVKKGDVLAIINPDTINQTIARYEAQLNSAKASLNSSKVQYNNKLINYNRLSEVYKVTGGKSPSKTELDNAQMEQLHQVLTHCLWEVEMLKNDSTVAHKNEKTNEDFAEMFLSAKKVEGCSEKTLRYYKASLNKFFHTVDKHVTHITTDDLRAYLANYLQESQCSKTNIDNIRRILSSFFSWLEDEDYILKNPVRRIHKIKKGRVIKDVLSDEHLEILRDNCEDIRDLAMLELLISTGIRVGELVNLNVNDVNFNERECVVFGKGESEREVYFDAKTKIHLLNYLETRVDNNPALFVSLRKPYVRLGISGVERRLRELGQKSNINKVHPHKFRRTLATNAIDKGMPIEQVQRLLGHVQIDTTMQYAMVNQNNVKLSHKKFIS